MIHYLLVTPSIFKRSAHMFAASVAGVSVALTHMLVLAPGEIKRGLIIACIRSWARIVNSFCGASNQGVMGECSN